MDTVVPGQPQESVLPPTCVEAGPFVASLLCTPGWPVHKILGLSFSTPHLGASGVTDICNAVSSFYRGSGDLKSGPPHECASGTYPQSQLPSPGVLRVFLPKLMLDH